MHIDRTQDDDHQHLPDWIGSPNEAKVWKFIYLLTFAAIGTMLAVSFNFYRQGQDRAQVQELAQGNRARSCATIGLIKSTRMETAFEVKLKTLTLKSPIACSDSDTGK